MSKKIWFGKPGAFQYMPCPAAGITVGAQGYSETLEFENGGAAIVRSQQRHRIFEFDFPVQDASLAGGLDVYTDYATGFYGDGPWYFTDPMAYDQNILPPVYSSPWLINAGWENWGPVEPVFDDGSGSNRGRPPTTTWAWDADQADDIDFGYLIPVPVDCYLEIGFAGLLENVDVVVDSYLPDGTLDTTDNMVMLSSLGSAFTNYTVDPGHAWVTVSFVGQSGLLGRLHLNSAVARIREPNRPLPAMTSFVTGRGSTAVEFDGETIPETYIMQDRHLKGLSFQMREVGLWR